ncbi:MAG: DUF2249 domain-containing protein [Paracoccaceae bacterium]|nr:DUF2249 domain-containing protein [Paracoccaceae bacterium]
MTQDLPGHDWQQEDGLHINVQGLQPPEPMLGILGRIDSLTAPAQVTVHHDRDPIYLYPELAERGWSWEIVPGEPGEVRLILRKRP